MGCLYIIVFILLMAVIISFNPVFGIVVTVAILIYYLNSGFRKSGEDKPQALEIDVSIRSRRKRVKKRSFQTVIKNFEKYVVIDIETTGLNPGYDSIIELGGIKVDDGKIIEEYSTLVNPGIPISREIESITGITTRMVKKAPPIESVLSEYLDFAENLPVVGHNIRFDLSFIYSDVDRLGMHFAPEAYVDTCRLSRRAFPELSNHKLVTLLEHCDIRVDRSHRALDDVIATWELYKICCDVLKL